MGANLNFSINVPTIMRNWGDGKMLNKSDFNKLDERLKNITSKPVEQIEINSD